MLRKIITLFLVFAFLSVAFATAGTKQTTNMNTKNTLISAGRMLNREIRAEGERIGEVTDLIVDPSTGLVPFLVVAQGGFYGIADDKYLLPWEYVDAKAHSDGNEAPYFKVTKKDFKLQSGLKTDPEESIVSYDRIQQAYKQYGLENTVAELRNARDKITAQKTKQAELYEKIKWMNDDPLVAFTKLMFRTAKDVNGKEIGLITAMMMDPKEGIILLAYVDKGPNVFIWAETTIKESMAALPWPALHADRVEGDFILAVEPKLIENAPVIMPDEYECCPGSKAATIFKNMDVHDFRKNLNR